MVSQYSSILSPICVDAVLRVIDPAKDTNVDLRDIKIIQKLGSVGHSVGTAVYSVSCTVHIMLSPSLK